MNDFDINRITAAAATTAAPNVSEKYKFISTSTALEALQPLGWQVIGGKQVRARGEDRQGMQRHMLILRNPNYGLAISKVGDRQAQVVFENAHDGTGAFKLTAGIYELICSNGMMSSSQEMSMSVRHIGYTDDKLRDAISAIGNRFPALMGEVETFQNVLLTNDEARGLAKSVIDLKWNGEEFAVEPEELLVVQHRGQEENNLWNVGNRIQERVMRGGAEVRKVKSDSKKRASRAVNSVTEISRLNRAIWTLMQSQAAIKGAMDMPPAMREALEELNRAA
jgi:hypothetical protein